MVDQGLAVTVTFFLQGGELWWGWCLWGRKCVRSYGSAAFWGGMSSTSDRGSSFGGLELQHGGGGVGRLFGEPLSSVVVPTDTKGNH